MEVVEIGLGLKVEFMKKIHECEREGSTRSRMCCGVPPYAKELWPMRQVAFVVVVAATEGHIDSVDAGDIENDEVLYSYSLYLLQSQIITYASLIHYWLSNKVFVKQKCWKPKWSQCANIHSGVDMKKSKMLTDFAYPSNKKLLS